MTNNKIIGTIFLSQAYLCFALIAFLSGQLLSFLIVSAIVFFIVVGFYYLLKDI